ncbi:MAG: TonB-dependent receptor [Bacteroidota bacterium]
MNNRLLSISLTGLMVVCIVPILLGQELASTHLVPSYYPYQQVEEQQSLASILNRLGKRHQVNFFFESNTGERTVGNIPISTTEKLEQSLEKILVPLNLTYEKVGDIYMIQPEKNAPAIPKLLRKAPKSSENEKSSTPLHDPSKLVEVRSISQKIIQQTISGRVTDLTNNEGLPGVNILAKGTNTGTVTDIEGNYRLNVSDDVTILVFSSVGYETEEVEINGRTTINMSLSPDIQSLSEVVVVGYGNQERAKVSSAISSVGGEEIAELPVVSPEQALQGRVPGLNITGSGAPGRPANIRIRGIGSTRNSDPLIVIDGVPVGQGRLSDVHPNNIGSISVLKDAASSAIYGSRAGNGVIIVTTKDGEVGPPKFSFQSYYGVQDVPQRFDLLNAQQYLDFGREYTAAGGSGVPARFNDLGEEFTGVDTDWQDAVMPGGPIQDYYLRASGGNETFKYNMGGGYFSQDGAIVNTYFRRASFNINTSADLNRFKVGQSLIAARTVNNVEDGVSIRRSIQMMPYIPVRYEEQFSEGRKGGFRGPDGAEGSDPFQPVLFNELIEDEEVSWNVFGTVFAEYELFDGFSYRFQAGADFRNRNQENYTPTFNAGGVQFNVNPFPSLEKRNIYDISTIITHQLNYTKSFGNHNVDVVAGYERQITEGENIFARSDSLNNENVRDIGNSLPRTQFGGSTAYQIGIESLFGRLNYDYLGRYLVTLSLRRDRASVFGPDVNVGVFPAVSAAWRLSDEPFLDGISNVFSDLKLRGSWGVNGNTSIDAYGWDPTVFSNINYAFNDVLSSGLTVNQLFNRSIAWEEVRKINIGLDAELLQGKVALVFEYFNNRVNDLVINVPLPNSAGIDGSPLANIGDIQNSGFEFGAGFFERTGDVKWSVQGNFGYVNNEVKALGFNETSTIAGPNFQNTGETATFAQLGEPVGYFFGYKVDRIYQNQAEIDADNEMAESMGHDAYQFNSTSPGDIRFQDLNGDGTISGEDRTNIGHYLPPINYGLVGTVEYKNIDFGITLQGAAGHEVLNANRFYTEGMTRLFNMGTDVLDAWTPQNTDTDIPRAVITDPNRNARISDRFIENGSFLRIKFLSLGYSLPESLLSTFANGALSKVRIYFTSSNLWTITGYTGLDPEVQGRPSGQALFQAGIDDSNIPQMRSIIGGLQIEF